MLGSLGKYFSWSLDFSTLKIFDRKMVPSAMLSEEVSLVIGLSALYWALSMVCMVIGIWQLSSKDRNQRK